MELFPEDSGTQNRPELTLKKQPGTRSSVGLVQEPTPQVSTHLASPTQDLATSLLGRLERLEERLHRLEGNVAQSASLEGESLFDLDLAEDLVRPEGLNFGLDDLLRTVIKNRASDLHIKPHSPPVVRLEGTLVPIGDRALTEEESRYLVLSALPPRKRLPLTALQEVDHAYICFGVRFRLNAFLERGNVSAAFRTINTSVPRFEELGLPPVLEQLASLQDGLVLITGPAGSGKSTTLASVVDWINEHRRVHVVTIEDPIEYHHRDRTSFISQREIGSDTTSFTEALKQALRQDPNVIMLGEMRDAETIMTAITAAETGHLVLSTLHTPNTVGAIDRVLDSFAGNMQNQVRLLLASSLRGVVSQKLLRRQDGHGRVPAIEVLINTSTIASLILEGQTQEIYQYLQRGESEGMQTFTASLLSLYEQGLVSFKDAAQMADRKTEFRLASEQRAKLRGRAPKGPMTALPGSSGPPQSGGDLLDLL